MEINQLKELATGRYLKIVDGEDRGEATPGEVRCYFFRKGSPLRKLASWRLLSHWSD